MLSATAYVDERMPTYEPPPNVLSDPESAEAWILSLPAQARTNLTKRLAQIYQGLPAAAQLAIQRAIIADGHTMPVSPTVDGLGQWGALITAVSQIGTTLYTSKMQNNLTEDLQSNALAQNAQIAAARLEAEKQTQLALIQAQREAAQLASASSSATTALFASYMPYYLAGGVAVLGLGIFLYLRTRKA